MHSSHKGDVHTSYKGQSFFMCQGEHVLHSMMSYFFNPHLL